MALRLPLGIRHLRTPPSLLYRKIKRRLGVAGRQMLDRWKGELWGTYLQQTPGCILARCVQTPAKSLLVNITRELGVLATLCLEHRFDLLGSGGVKVAYGIECNGFEGYQYPPQQYSAPDATGAWLSSRINSANLSEAQRIWRLVDQEYEPIDWQLDFKSGYRWKDSAWYLDIDIPYDCLGADIKVPWELARCQHLPQLGLAYIAATYGLYDGKDRYAREFRNQVLDFLANNPPGFGVNWRCTMDVAIRITNWLIAHDLFVAAGVLFDSHFNALLSRSAMEHARHIVGNVEWSDSGRSNHYLSNVVGLLAVAVYLPQTAETDAWSGWALREFVLEVEGQFDADGCNREGSTCYHRLSTELVIYGVAFACRLLHSRPHVAMAGLRRVPYLSGWGGRDNSVLALVALDLSAGNLPMWVWQRLYGMGKFIAAITKPNGSVPQVGDNDSGRLLKIHPNDLVLDHRHILGALAAFFDDEEFQEVGSKYRVEADLLRTIVGSDHSVSRHAQALTQCRVGQIGNLDRHIAAFDQAPAMFKQYYEFVLPDEDVLEQSFAVGFVDFGIFVLRGKGFYAAFRCGPTEQYGQGSHLHHDQLALELSIGGEDLVLDPGSYVYTPLPVSRNVYRSLRAHFAPWPVTAEYEALDEGLFVFRGDYRAECLYFQPDGMVGRHFGFEAPTYRIINVEANRLVVRDFSEAVSLERCPFKGEPFRFVGLPFSDQYGGISR